MISLYSIKPQFQALLRPIVKKMADIGITANQVTLCAMFISIGVGLSLMIWGEAHRQLFFIVPLWMFLRMAFNAIDGMLAREFNQRSALGAYLNELSDVISDAALYLPFALIAPFNFYIIFGLIFCICLSEMSGILASAVGTTRRYDGPMGKSDRALVFGALGLWIAIQSTLPDFISYGMWLMIVAILINCFIRIRSGVQHAKLDSLKG